MIFFLWFFSGLCMIFFFGFSVAFLWLFYGLYLPCCPRHGFSLPCCPRHLKSVFFSMAQFPQHLKYFCFSLASLSLPIGFPLASHWLPIGFPFVFLWLAVQGTKVFSSGLFFTAPKVFDAFNFNLCKICLAHV